MENSVFRKTKLYLNFWFVLYMCGFFHCIDLHKMLDVKNKRGKNIAWGREREEERCL